MNRHRVLHTCAMAFCSLVVLLAIGSTAGAAAATAVGEQAAYVAEHETDSDSAEKGYLTNEGVAAFIDGANDTLATRTATGSLLTSVAVSPDNSRVYMTDSDEPMLHVLDATTGRALRDIPLPGVTAPNAEKRANAMRDLTIPIEYSVWATCARGVACTPDGRFVLVCTNAGLQVVDTATDQVVRTLGELAGYCVAVSFDGARAYVGVNEYRDRPAQTWAKWMMLVAEGTGNRLVCLDLTTWEVIEEMATATVASIAIKPDDGAVFFSEPYNHLVRVVDPRTLEELWSVRTDPSFALGLGFVPNGTKGYVVCSADTDIVGYYSGATITPKAPAAEDYFCAVIDTSRRQIVKRIPLEAY